MKYRKFKSELFNLEKLIKFINGLEKFKECKNYLSYLPEDLKSEISKINGNLSEILLVLKTISHLEIDPVSGIAINSGYFQYLYEKPLIEYSISNDLDIYVLGIDIYNLKGVNENYGHWIGDLYIKECITKIVNQLENSYEKYLPVRWRGDEFVFFILTKENIENKEFDNKVKIPYNNSSNSIVEGGFRYSIKLVKKSEGLEKYTDNLKATIFETLDYCKKKPF